MWKKSEENKLEENKNLKEKEIPKSFIFDNKNVHKIVDGLLKRKSFFKNFEKYDFGKSLFKKYENEYCKKFFDKTMDEDIHEIIKYRF